ncbi:uncharacterized protein LOC128997938 [Macrosteles quadrilineatus]|uniref:uncharacterized protein LOC128997938 n=1 Tax=Macrosteles quadrilineatus TaxID=74068 RepID=UPI0023E251D0|nr:uncharacterized protein LOC128997938 [Macrosteles quadrilineatus]
MREVRMYVSLLCLCLLRLVSDTNESTVLCSNESVCQSTWGVHSVCDQGNCDCQNLYYLANSTTCTECPGIGESCSDSQCCNQDYLICHKGVCMCIYSDYCWTISAADRERFQHVAQCILAVTLMLTATILFILFWKACSRRSVVRRNLRHNSDSILSLNSIQRLVLMQLQDRPPPYSAEWSQPTKHVNELCEPPPSYIEAVGTARVTAYEENFTLPSHLIVLTNTELHM